MVFGFYSMCEFSARLFERALLSSRLPIECGGVDMKSRGCSRMGRMNDG